MQANKGFCRGEEWERRRIVDLTASKRGWRQEGMKATKRKMVDERGRPWLRSAKREKVLMGRVESDTIGRVSSRTSDSEDKKTTNKKWRQVDQKMLLIVLFVRLRKWSSN